MIYLTLFLEFFKIGLFTFGGGYAMIPLIRETVLKYGWLSEMQFLEFLGVCESTPGPIAVNMATYIGSTQAGILGSLCATIGVVLPSFIIILIIAKVIKKINKNQYFQSFFNGVKPVVVALIICSGLFLILKVFGFNSLQSFDISLTPIIIFALLAIAYVGYRLILKKNINPIVFILLSAVLGIGISFIGI